MVFVRVSETYDLSTKVGKMGLLGIHTPTSDLVTRLYPGLLQNCKFVRFDKCDVAMACASMLPADPLQIGVEAGAIAPQDMFNPILYKAVSNESMSNLQAWLQSMNGKSTAPVSKNSVLDVNDATFADDAISQTDDVDQFKMYYALLSSPDGWRKAMPQAGLEMNDLVPLVYQVVANYGGISPRVSTNRYYDINNANQPQADSLMQAPPSDTSHATAIPVATFRGPSMRMPKVPTTIMNYAGASPGDKGVSGDTFFSADTNHVSLLRYVPATYVAMIVLPPAKLNQLYYRLKVTWTLEFTEVRPFTDIQRWSAMANLGDIGYGSDYDVQSTALMSNLEGLADTANADLTKIMEGS